jgi:hypothetical protein
VSSLVDGGLNVLEERADLSRNRLALNGRLDCAASGMTENEDDLRPEDGGAVFEAADDFRRHHVAGDTGYKDVSDGLVEDDFDRHARIGAGEDGGERLLFVDRVVTQNSQVLIEAGEVAGNRALVAGEEGLEGFVGVSLLWARAGSVLKKLIEAAPARVAAVPARAVPRNLRRERAALGEFGRLFIGVFLTLSWRSNHNLRCTHNFSKSQTRGAHASYATIAGSGNASLGFACDLKGVALIVMWRSVWELFGVPLKSGRPTWKDKRHFARTESFSDYRGKYLILLVNSRHIRGGYCPARVAAERQHYAK